MEKKTKIKSAAGSKATGRNVEARLAAAKKTPSAKPCTENCAALKSCTTNRKECPVLVRCGINKGVFE